MKGLPEIPELEPQIAVLELPVVFGKASELLLEKIRELEPAAVISVGLAGSRKEITPELIAVNLRNARIPDNEGNQPEFEKIVRDGPDGIFTRLPVRQMIAGMRYA